MYEKFYQEMYRIRRVEEEVARIYPTDKIKSPVHLSIGQEGISVGVCQALQPQDIVFGTYRSHALYLAKGGNLKEMVAELYGKATGCTEGKGGSMHLIDRKAGVMGASAIVGTAIPHAVGYAYAVKMRKDPVVVANFFGDGAVDEGVYHESLNFAALKKLPVLFICENNFYSIHAHQNTRQPLLNIMERAAQYGIPATRIENNDTMSIYQQVGEAVKIMRETHEGPYFFECMTYRWMEHVGPNQDFQYGYRRKEEAATWMENDQVKLIGDKLDAATRQRIEQEVEAEIAEAFAFAEASPFPGEEVLYTNLFKEN